MIMSVGIGFGLGLYVDRAERKGFIEAFLPSQSVGRIMRLLMINVEKGDETASKPRIDNTLNGKSYACMWMR
jgi:hypothetical protein